MVNSSPTVAEGKVFIGAYKMGSEDTGTYFALDERTGGILWSKTVGDFAQSTPAYAKGKVYVGWADGSLQKGGIACLDASNGAVAWQQETTYGVWGSAATGDGLVYAPTYNFSEPGVGKLYALNKADGSVLWCRDVVSTDTTPAIACNRVYLSSGYPSEWTPWLEIKTYCFDARSGEPVWEKQDVGGWTCSPAVADNKVFVGKIKVVDWSSVYEGTYALDAGDGSVIWESPAGGSSPAVVFHKRLYTVGDGKVYAFRSPLLKFEEIAEPAEAQELESSMF
ncbi:MAG: PQQ-binding-like beta-propeller repeat protein [Firmicutes bacterium]|nr:PQQ-binding-like beta-propeller repeat protein [Bacillota bacterium]